MKWGRKKTSIAYDKEGNKRLEVHPKRKKNHMMDMLVYMKTANNSST